MDYLDYVNALWLKIRVLFKVVIFVLLSYYLTLRTLCDALQFVRLVNVGIRLWLPTMRKVEVTGQTHYLYRDMSVKVRIQAFNSLGNVELVSKDLLLLTLSKKASPAMKEKNFPGQFTTKSSKLPASSAAFAFVNGLEDEFYEVRSSACRALQRLTILSADFAGEAIDLLVDVL
ncbi:unnamed protein product, partial [Cuscuta epithymum]